MKQPLLFASGNAAKVAQARFIVEHFAWPLEIIRAKDLFGDQAKYEEIGETVQEVALNGAIAVCKAIQRPVITEDTDFRVDAHDGFPGIRAGAFLKEFGRQELLCRVKGQTNRRATINSAVGYVTPEGEARVFTHSIHGVIALTERFDTFPDWIAPTEENPFGGGYNAIFVPDGHERTLAEISPEEALMFSYRETTLRAAMEYILERYPR